MENLEIIISLAATLASTIIACITFVVKLIASVKARAKTEGKNALLSAVVSVVEAAEAMVDYSGSEKKEYVLTKMNQYAIDNGIQFDFEAVSEKIEELVELSKKVNAQGKSFIADAFEQNKRQVITVPYRKNRS